MADGKFVAYYRVSTDKQEKSGLGLEAQKTAVQNYLNGGGWELVGEFEEAETGKGHKALERRPQLLAALDACKKHGAMLIIAKLDRLARNVHFVSGLMESRIKFVACDMPNANEFTIHIMAAVAQHEAERISQRTKDALQEAKRRGVTLGATCEENFGPGREKRKNEAVEFAKSLKATIEEMRARQFTQKRMVDELNKAGKKTRNGGNWSLTQLQRVLRRIDESQRSELYGSW